MSTTVGDTANPWTIGVARLGNGPKTPAPEPLSYLHVTRVSEYRTPDHFSTPEQAITERIKRLREQSTKYQQAGNTITYNEPVTGDHITLTYIDKETP